MAAEDHLSGQFEEARKTWEGDGSYEMGESLKDSSHHLDSYRGLAQTLQGAAKENRIGAHLYSGQYAPEGAHHEGAVMHFPLLATSRNEKDAETFSKGHHGGPTADESFVYHIEPGATGVPINHQEVAVTGNYRVHRLSVTRTSEGEEKRSLHLRRVT